MDDKDLSHIAGTVEEFIYDETEDSMEAIVDILNTPQGRTLDKLLSDNQTVSLSVCGYNLDDDSIDDKPHVITNYQLDSIQAYPYQDIWDNKIKYYKKE